MLPYDGMLLWRIQYRESNNVPTIVATETPKMYGSASAQNSRFTIIAPIMATQTINTAKAASLWIVDERLIVA